MGFHLLCWLFQASEHTPTHVPMFAHKAKQAYTMIEDQESLPKDLLARLLVGLLTLQGTGAGLGAKSDHISSHVPPPSIALVLK